MSREHYIDKRYGKLVVLSCEDDNKHCKVKCDCGEIESKLYTKLPYRYQCRKCSYKEMGMKGRKKYDELDNILIGRYNAMINRCTNKKHSNYHRYGGRGIKIDSSWDTKEKFLAWAKPRYVEGLELDRINNNGDYGPNNCRYVSHKENCRNKTAALANKSNTLPIGVTYCGTRYKAQRSGNYLGLFDTPEEAHIAWEKA